jgi:hypothetical protein
MPLSDFISPAVPDVGLSAPEHLEAGGNPATELGGGTKPFRGSMPGRP